MSHKNMEYVITKEDFRKWCFMSVDDLERIPENEKKMKLLLQDNKEDVFIQAGDMMTEDLLSNNAAGRPTRWVLPIGPNEQFERFIERVNKERISLKNAYIFIMDAGLDWQGRLYPYENFRFNARRKMEAWFFDKIDPDLTVPHENRYYPDPSKLDEIDDKIEELGGLDIVMGGVGFKGLVAANEDPRTPYHHISHEEYANSKTRVVWCNPDTIVAYAERSMGGCYNALSPMMITIGFKSMLKAKKAIFIVTTGAWKQTVVRVALFAEPTLEYPVTFFPKYVPECYLLCDRHTADHAIAHNPYREDMFWER